MSPALLRVAGEALYGTRWKSPLARDLDITKRTMERWAGGEYTIPDWVWPEIEQLLKSRAVAIGDLLA